MSGIDSARRKWLSKSFLAFALIFALGGAQDNLSRAQSAPQDTPEEPSDETDAVSPLELKPAVPAKRSGKMAPVPMPPEKPANLRQAIRPATDEEPQAAPQLANVPAPRGLFGAFTQPAPKPEVEVQAEEPVTETGDLPDKVLNGKIDPSIPLPPLKPGLVLPVPPSMQQPNPEEKDEEGEEESVAPGVEKQVDSVEIACIKPEVMNIVKKAGVFFRGIPIITSGYRARGRRGSLHRRCMAVDFIIPDVSTQTLARYLRTLPEAGGVGTYCHTKSVHIDIGDARNWGYCGFRRTYFSMR